LFTLQGLRYNTATMLNQRLESTWLSGHGFLEAYQQQSSTLYQVQQERDWLRTRRFQLELERGDHL
jgi:hypothetical protein